MKLVYIAGPYRSATRWGTEENIHRAESCGIQVAKLGAYPVIPHANTRGYFEDVRPGEFWLEGTLDLMRRCDAVFLMRGWEESEGARGERDEAVRLGIPVFGSWTTFQSWLDQQQG